MDPSHPDFHNLVINKIIIPDIIEQDQRREYAAFAALLTLVNNQQESSDEYDSEYDYESGSGSKSREEEEKKPIIPEQALERSVARKRPHSELNSRAVPPPNAPTPANKRARIEDVAFAPQPSNPQPANAEPKGIPQKSKAFYSPDEAICKINPKEPYAYDRSTAIAEVKVRHGGVAMEKAQAIVSTRFLNDPQAACKYSGLKDDAKESFFNQLLREGFEKASPAALAAVTAPAVPTASKESGGAKPTQQQQQQFKVEQERAKPVATPAPKRDQIQIQTTKLRSDALKQVDARSQGKLEDRVRLWLDNIIPS